MKNEDELISEKREESRQKKKILNDDLFWAIKTVIKGKNSR